MAKISCHPIFSCRKKKERMGTKIYPEASKAGNSLRFNPCRIAATLISMEPKKMAYARMTRQLSIEANHDLCSRVALFLSKICEQEQAKIPSMTKRYIMPFALSCRRAP